jgi:predicted DNA-binding transcriptional regulator AlpA
VNDALPFRPPSAPPAPTLAVEPLLLSARDLAVMLRLGIRTVRAMDAAGKLPAPLRVGGSVRWRLDELRAWLDAGAPDRETWARIRDARK